jgi:hypothetical protein
MPAHAMARTVRQPASKIQCSGKMLADPQVRTQRHPVQGAADVPDGRPIVSIGQSGWTSIPNSAARFIRWLSAAMIFRSAIVNCGRLT